MESLEWSECNETLDDILKNPRVQLPQLIKLSSPFLDINTNECIEKDQIVVLHSKETVEKVQGVTHDGKTINIPIGCPHKTRRRVSPGKEKIFESIKDLAKAEPLPRFVEVKEVEGVENVANGDRLKVVIVEKTGGVPAFIHFRSSNGKHIKMSVDEKISFQSSVSDGSDQNIAKLTEKSREFPISAEFQKKDVPKSHTDLGVFTINRCSSDIVVIASAKKSNNDYVIVFPLDTEFKFQVNSKLKMAKDEEYRQLCENSSTINPDDITIYLNHANPMDSVMQYVLTYKKLQKILKFDYTDDEPSPKQKTKVSKKDKKEQSKKEKESNGNAKESSNPPQEDRKDSPVHVENDENVEAVPPNTLVVDSEQKEILKKELKERERQAKLEKEQLKAEKKKEKKLRKEKEKEEKKKKKLSTSSISNPSSPTEIQSEDLYVVPQDEKRVSPSPSNESSEPSDEQHSQLTMHLMNTLKKVRDRTQSIGFKNKSKKRGKLRKEDIQYISSDPIAPEPEEQDSYYAGLDDDAFSESLYEALPGEMAYESLDLVAQAQRSFAPQPSTENNGDSGFDEIDQARIQAWRDSMAPPPLPGNHPLQHSVSQPQEENLYETAVDCRGAMPSAWQSFYNSVEQSTTEISSWDMEDVASCLTDILLGNYIEVFSDSQVDGQLLLDLDESVLRDLGLNPFEARKLRKFVFGWRPDIIRPPAYPNRFGFESNDPTQWSQEDVVKHLKVIDIDDFADFCEENQVNGELLKDICVDENIMNSIITTRDKKLKTVKIKNYVIDKWRPKKKGEGNYMSSISILPPERRGLSSPNINKAGNNSPKTVSLKSTTSTSPTINKDENTSPKAVSLKNTTRKVSDGTTPGINRKITTGDMPLIAKVKQQLEENKNAWEKRK